MAQNDITRGAQKQIHQNSMVQIKLFYTMFYNEQNRPPATLEEFLNRAGQFLPVRLGSGDSAMIARDALLEVVAAKDAAPMSGAGIPNVDIVRVQLREGSEIEGVVHGRFTAGVAPVNAETG